MATRKGFSIFYSVVSESRWIGANRPMFRKELHPGVAMAEEWRNHLVPQLGWYRE